MTSANNYRVRPQRGKVNSSTSRIFSQLFIDTNLDLCIIGALLAFYYNDSLKSYAQELDFEGGEVANPGNATQGLPNDQAMYAILFPWFAQTISVFIYYTLSRYLKVLPYTAIVFLFGVVIGAVTKPTLSANREANALTYSAAIWLDMDGLVILLVFLPGLIFNDTFTINVHLFFQSFWQLIIFAFPMVLGGAYLTALVAKYLLPIDWPHTLCMVFGAILSGTDPIAVAGLLKTAGAPDRLNIHISGESLLNDGSVVVLFNIFSRLYYHDNGFHENSGQKNYTLGEGFEYFFRLTLGGCAIGLAFGLGTVLMLKQLNRRLSERENQFQVVLLVSSAYLGYFTAEVIAGCSGIIATITCGITVKVLGETFINDHALTLHFWQVTAELLNQLLFVLGGCLWGDIVSRNSFIYTFSGWGYLVLLYVLLIVIRFVLIFGLYPITSRIGIGTNVKESVFMSYGGFRGTVGIALALSLNSTVHQYSADVNLQTDTDTFFVIVGGISIMTLLINGMTSGPLLSAYVCELHPIQCLFWVYHFSHQMESLFYFFKTCLQEYVRLLSQPRWKGIDHSIIKEHVPFLNDISFDDLMVAVERNQNNTPVHLYIKPRLEHVFPYLRVEQIKVRVRQLSSRSLRGEDLFKSQSSQSFERLVARERSFSSPATRKAEDKRMWNDFFSVPADHEENNVENSDDTNEILKSAYYHQIDSGSLEEFGDLPYSLFQGLHFCEDTCAKGHPLNDWEATKVASDTRVVLANNIFPMLLLRVRQLWRRERNCCSGPHWFRPAMFKIRFLIRLNLAFVGAHRYSRRVFESQFASNPLTPAEEQIIKESEAQIKLAEADLNKIDQVDVNTVKGHLLTLILLKKSVQFVEQLSRQNLIPEAAASELLEKLDGYVENVSLCKKLYKEHNETLNTATKILRLRRLPSNIIEEYNILGAIDEMTKTTLSPPTRDVSNQTLSNTHRADNRTSRADCDQHNPPNLQTTIPTRDSGTDQDDIPVEF
ncbi:hypothetical protein ACHAW5_010534 [Stephanodiscus triporus]|uniref:Cation/H+ exchanger transmembrane domain-containing protein n=1 Tax=Stephanodiscus triporus TaxID=2934178 RepID=A0ABD3P255_9STRA